MELDFFEFDDGETPRRDEMDPWRSDDDEDQEGPNSVNNAAEARAFWDSHHHLLQDALSPRSPTESRVERCAEDIVRKMQSAGTLCTCLKECRRNCRLRELVDGLRDLGYDAALCRSKWRSSSDIPSGEHYYIDVIVESRNKNKGPMRIVIEPNFRAEFEMARANSKYNRLVSELPEIFVGKSERLRNVIKIMCGAAKKCMKDNKMHMAPWRKYKYMQAKWLGTCDRVVMGLPFPRAAEASSCDSGHRPPVRPRASMLTFDLRCPAVEVA